MTDTTEAEDLAELIGEEPFNHPKCFDSAYYADWEKDVAEPLLREQGFEIVRWYSGDSDSFGPLVRVVVLRKDGRTLEYYYG